MQHVYAKYKNSEWIFIIPLVLLNLGKMLAHFFWLLTSGKGFPQSADSKWYLEYAQSLIANFSIGLHMNDIMYFGYNMLLAFLLAVFEDPVAVLFIQAVTAGLSIIFVYKIAKLLFNQTTAVIASLFFYTLYDIQLWTTYILTESFFISLLLLCVYLLLKALERQTTKHWIVFSLTAAYLTVFRPSGVVIMAAILSYLFKQQNTLSMKDLIHKYKLPLGFSAAAISFGFIYMVANHKLLPLVHSIEFNVKMVLYNVYAKGWLYDLPTPYDHKFRPDYDIDVYDSLTLSFIVNNWEHVLVLYAKRTVAFLGKWVWKIDLTSWQGIVLFAYNVLPTALFITGTMAAIRKNSFQKAAILWFIVFAVYLFCTLLFIDWMYRYRSPATPFIAIIAAYGAESILSSAKSLINKRAGISL